MKSPYHPLFLSFVLGSLIYAISCQDKPAQQPAASLYRTTLDQKKLLEKEDLFIAKSACEATATITLDTTTTYQEMDGFGYTLTGGSALHLHKMSAPAREAILQELFGTAPGELGISYIRLSIGASDLDEYPWSYDDLPGGETDEALEHFSLAYDTLYLIPTLQAILKIAPNLKLLGSPWSPPAWMKDNKDTRGGSLLPEYYPVYANYFVKYIRAMEDQGIAIDAVTIQNEPLHPGNNPSLLMLPEAQQVFVRDYLGPAFRENDIHTKIVLYDHNADRPDYPISILDDPEAAKYVDGSAFHLYGGSIEALSEVHEAHPDKHLYFTEQWIGAPGNFPDNLSWHIENLIIGAPRNWCRTVLQWNLAADENQDPHTDRGGCDRCLGAITIDGDSITRNPAYYIIAHASRFVRPGSVRIASNLPDGIPNVAYRGPEGQTVVIVQNIREEAADICLKKGENQLGLSLGAGDVGTVVWD